MARRTGPMFGRTDAVVLLAQVRHGVAHQRLGPVQGIGDLRAWQRCRRQHVVLGSRARVAQSQPHPEHRRPEVLRGVERDAVPGVQPVQVDRGAPQAQRQDQDPMHGDRRDRLVRHEPPVVCPAHPAVLDGDVGPLVERLRRIEVGELDLRIDDRVGRERLHDRPSEVLAGLDHVRLERVGPVRRWRRSHASTCGASPTKLIAGFAHACEGSRSLQRIDADLAVSTRGPRSAAEEAPCPPRPGSRTEADDGPPVLSCVRGRAAGEQRDSQGDRNCDRVHASAKPSSPSMHRGWFGNPATGP